jgi:D-alanine-D-alanine ligase
MFLARDKALSKKILQYHRIPVPDFLVVKRGARAIVPKRLRFPVIVKSLTQEASIGISQASVVLDESKFRERVQFVHDSIGTDAIAERYIEGRELYVGVLGNTRLRVLPVWEMTFDNLPERQRNIATERVKWSRKHQAKVGLATDAAQNLDEALTKKIQHIARRAYRVLEMSGYGRIDLRLDAEGRVYVLEANPNPQIAEYEDFALSAHHDGLTYRNLIQRILTIGLSWEPERHG